MDALKQSLSGMPENYVYPFYWQQGVAQDILLTELEKIEESGAKAVCIEARPHPDFAGPRWWSDIDMIMAYAKDHDMKVWLLDDDHFPTGHANGAFSDGKNPLANRFLTVHATDVNGPIKGGYMPVTTYLPEDAEVICVLMCRRSSEHNDHLDAGSFVELTDRITDGWIRFDVPEGFWRILVFYATCHGNGKLDYFNILDSRSVRVLIDQVYEPHYARYQRYFGNVFQGFFSDEPEFGNLPGYEFRSRLGKDMPFIPWSEELCVRLKKRWGESFSSFLPALWYECGEDTDAIRYMYMDETTKQLMAAFSQQIGSWCMERGVIHIGHIIEDDNAHGRLACSTGHYFRSISGMGLAGIDVVHLEIMPGMTQEIRHWMAGDRDGEFFHYGLAKLGSSLAHIDRKKKGNTMCELFGAYGWQEGISLMQWLTDHMISRGVTYFVPHAYSPKAYPDPDCPPHFYANGHHPQFLFFGELTRYMNRVSNLLTGGHYPAQAAVLYHVDSEWAGDAMLYQKPLRVLMEHQIEADVLPADVFSCFAPEKKEIDLSGIPQYDTRFDGKLHVADQTYSMLIIPGCQYLPEYAAAFVGKAVQEGFPVCFIGRRPEGICGYTAAEQKQLQYMDAILTLPVIELTELYAFCLEHLESTFSLEHEFAGLRSWRYQKDGREYIFLFNENTGVRLTDQVEIRTSADSAWWYDARKNIVYPVKRYTDDHMNRHADGVLKIEIDLAPGQSLILVLGDIPEGTKCAAVYEAKETKFLDCACHITAREVLTDRIVFEMMKENGEDMPDLSPRILHERFCGTLLYEYDVELYKDRDTMVRLTVCEEQDCIRVLLDGKETARMFGEPKETDLLIPAGSHKLTLELALTPAWENGDIWNALTVIPGAGLHQQPVIQVLR